MLFTATLLFFFKYLGLRYQSTVTECHYIISTPAIFDKAADSDCDSNDKCAGRDGCI